MRLHHHFVLIDKFFLFGKEFQCMECEWRQVFSSNVVSNILKGRKCFSECVTDFTRVCVIIWWCTMRYSKPYFTSFERCCR